MPDENTSELTEAEIQEIYKEINESQPNKQDDDFSYPQEKIKDSQYQLMRDMIATKESTKIANLDAQDLSIVRGHLRTALISKTLGIDVFAEYYKSEAEIFASSSMSKHVKNTNFLSLIFTQIKKTFTSSNSGQSQQKPRSFFDRFRNHNSESEE